MRYTPKIGDKVRVDKAWLSTVYSQGNSNSKYEGLSGVVTVGPSKEDRDIVVKMEDGNEIVVREWSPISKKKLIRKQPKACKHLWAPCVMQSDIVLAILQANPKVPTDPDIDGVHVICQHCLTKKVV